MAKAINFIEKKRKNEQEEQTESLTALLALVAENREALTSTLEIVGELQKFGVLDILKAALKQRNSLGVIAMEQLNQPSMHNTIKNGINTLQFLGELEPDKLKTLMHGVTTGLEYSNHDHKKLGIWELMRTMKDPNVSTSIATMMNFLEGMGKGINESEKTH